MDPMEAIMEELYNPGLRAPGMGGGVGAAPANLEDPRRRHVRGGGGIGGPAQSISSLLPYLMGAHYNNLTGFANQNLSGLVQNNPMAMPNAAPAGPNSQSINPSQGPPPSITLGGGVFGASGSRLGAQTGKSLMDLLGKGGFGTGGGQGPGGITPPNQSVSLGGHSGDKAKINPPGVW